MKKVVIVNTRSGKKTLVSEDKAKRIMASKIMNPFGRSVLKISKEDTINEVPKEIKEQVTKKDKENKSNDNQNQ